MEEKKTKCDLLENQRQSADARNHYINNRRNLSSHNKCENKMSIVIQVWGCVWCVCCLYHLDGPHAESTVLTTLKLQIAGV